MSVKDYEHQLQLEISENELRKDFSQLERLDYAKRLERVERLKAEERQAHGQTAPGKTLVQNFAEGQTGNTRDKVAQATGFGSGEQYRKAKHIAEHADEETLDKWDRGDITTHAAYVTLQEQNRKLRQQLEDELNKPEPEPIMRTPPDVLGQLECLKESLKSKEAELTKLKAEVSTGTQSRKKAELEQEIAGLMVALDKAKNSQNMSVRRASIVNGVSQPIHKLEKEAETVRQALDRSVMLSEFDRDTIRKKADFLRILSDDIMQFLGEVIIERGDIIDV